MSTQQAAIDAAKADARAAVDSLLDAIGRVLLAHLDTPTPEPEPEPEPLRTNKTWTTSEDNLIKTHYPTGGSAGVLEAGARRTAAAVNQRALYLGVKYATREREPRKAPKPTTRKRKPTGTTKPPPAVIRSPAQQLLTALIDADTQDLLLDAEDLTSTEKRALRKLRADQLAVMIAPGLWRPTLAGISRGRSQLEPVSTHERSAR